MSLRPLAIILVAILLAAPAAAKERTWTSADGRTMKAEFVREIDGVVTFLKEGKLVTIPLDKLSAEDQQIIRDLAMGKPIPDEEDPAPTAPTASDDSSASKAPDKTGDDKPAAAKITIEIRTWTDNRGNKTNAKFVRVNGNDVVLNRTGKILTVTFDSLSEADRQYIRDLLTQQGKEALIPAGSAASTSGDAGNTGVSATGPVTGGIPPRPTPPAGGGRGRGPGGPGGGMPGAGSLPGAGGRPGAGAPSGIGPAGIGPSGMGPGGIGPSGIDPGGGLPGRSGPGLGGGMPTGLPGAGTLPGTSGPATIPTPSAGIPGTMPGGAGPGMSSGIGSGTGSGASFPSSPHESQFPTRATGPDFPASPMSEQVYKCTGCSREISEAQSKLDKCPYCNTIWVYKDDGTGNKTMTAGSVRNLAIGLFAGIIVVVLGGVAGFIGIIVAVVRAVSRPAPRANYRRY